MSRYAVGRDEALSAMRAALEPLDHVQAMWEAGAIAFGMVENTLRTLSPIGLKYRLPEPIWHGHSQAFYRLEGAINDGLLSEDIRHAAGRTKGAEDHV